MMQAKQDFARLLLGMFAGTTPAFPVTYSYVGQAEAPQGKADVIDVKGPANFAARLFVADNGLPIMLSWQAPVGPAGQAVQERWRVREVRRQLRRRAGSTGCTLHRSTRSSTTCSAPTHRWSSSRSKTCSRTTPLLRRLSRSRRLEAALPHPARRRSGDDRRNHFRSLPDQRQGGSATFRHDREVSRLRKATAGQGYDMMRSVIASLALLI